MAETPKQYKQRLFGYLKGQHPLKVLRATPRKLERLLGGVSRKKLGRRPAPGKWSATEIAAHLADIEIVIGYRLRNVLGTNRVRIQAMDQDRWAASGNYRGRDPRQLIQLFRTLRASNLTLLNSQPRKRWKHYGRHEERGKESVAEMVRLFAGHDLNHLLQIRRILKG